MARIRQSGYRQQVSIRCTPPPTKRCASSRSAPDRAGPFGGGMSTALLAGTVSNHGGLGSYGAQPRARCDRSRRGGDPCATSHHSRSSLGVDHDPAARHSTRVLRAAWRVFAPYYRELGVEKPDCRLNSIRRSSTARGCSRRAAMFSFVFGVPSAAALAASGTRHRTIGAARRSRRRSLESAGVDLLCRHRGGGGRTSPSFLDAQRIACGTFRSCRSLPREARAGIAAGGIVDARGGCSTRAGAQAAQVGTAFWLARNPVPRTCIVSTVRHTRGAHDLTRSFTGRLARGIRNR